MGKCIIEVPTKIMMKIRWSPVLLINELWYCVRSLSSTITINSHLANFSTQNDFLAPVNAIFHQLLSSGKIYKLRFVNNYEWKLGNILFPLIQVFSPCLPRLLCYRPMKPRGTFDLPCILSTLCIHLSMRLHFHCTKNREMQKDSRTICCILLEQHMLTIKSDGT